MLTFLEDILIGIISGSISSVIVSIIFFMITNEEEDKKIAKEMINPLYEILTLTQVFKQYDNAYKEEYIQNSFKHLGENFSKFEPQSFSVELRSILNEINEFASSRYAYTPIQLEDLTHIHDESYRLISLFEDYEVNFAKNCFKKITRNKVLQTLLIVTILLVFILVIPLIIKLLSSIS